MTAPPLWPHQGRAIVLAEQAVREGHRSILVVLPTGGGKTRIMAELASRASSKGRRTGIISNRRILTSQASGALDRQGIPHGFLAAGRGLQREADVQILSLQTVASRVFGSGRWELPELDLLMVDEAHSNKAETAQRLLAHYMARRTVILGYTATPVGMSVQVDVEGDARPLWTRLIQAGVNSELRACGALVHCDVYAPDEPDMTGVKRRADGEWVGEQAARRVMDTLVVGNVFDYWKTLNPFGLPTMLWAPGVSESRWFAEQFEQRGITAAHIDGETEESERNRIFCGSQAGAIKVLCSCGVLREGADLPWIHHGILVQACGALSTYLQIVGRLLRSHPGKTRAILQDHVGAWHRHGSPNADRDWSLDDDDVSIARKLKKAREAGERQPICCPRCSGVRTSGPRCPFCGHEHARSVRMVRQVGGKLVRMVGDTVKRKKQQSAEQKAWTSCLYAAANGGRTVAQAAADFRRRTGQRLPPGLEHVPPHGSLDWHRAVTDVYPWMRRRR